MKNFNEIYDYIKVTRQKYTDKFHSGFAEFYFDYFKDKRESIEKIMEIGVNRAGSILFWKEYFVNAQIYGIDTRPRILNYVEDRVHMDVIDQGNRKTLLEYATINGPFDIIIDDGSHITSDQVASFETLWSFVTNGGHYIVEDIKVAQDIKYKNMEVDIVSYFNNTDKSEMEFINIKPNMIIMKKL